MWTYWFLIKRNEWVKSLKKKKVFIARESLSCGSTWLLQVYYKSYSYSCSLLPPPFMLFLLLTLPLLLTPLLLPAATQYNYHHHCLYNYSNWLVTFSWKVPCSVSPTKKLHQKRPKNATLLCQRKTEGGRENKRKIKDERGRRENQVKKRNKKKKSCLSIRLSIYPSIHL